MLIRRIKDIPSNNILILHVETFKQFSRTHILFCCMIIIASFSLATSSMQHLKKLKPKTMSLLICFQEKNKIEQ